VADLVTANGTEARVAIRRRVLVVCLWLAGAVLLGGLDFPAQGYAAFRFAPFGVVAGLLAIVWIFVLVHREVVWLPTGWLRALALVYWVAGTAMMFRVLLPPPGLVQAFLAVVAALAAGLVATRGERERAAIWLGVVAVALAVLRFAVVPAFWSRSSLPNWGPFGLGRTADSLREFFVAYAPERPAAQAVHFAALLCWALAVWTQWHAPQAHSSRA
jgi:hypothetical protein